LCTLSAVLVIIVSVVIRQVIKDRVMEHAGRSSFTWNTEPGALMILPEFSQSLGDYAFYWRHLPTSADTNSSRSSLFTAVICVTGHSSVYSASPLHRLMRALSKSSRLHKVDCLQGSKKPGFFTESPTQWVFWGVFWGFIGFFGQAGKIGKIIQKLSSLKP